MDLQQLRTVMEGHGPEWSRLLAQDLDPDTVLVEHRDDGSETHAPLGIRLAQVVHHGTDHRSQICTDLTSLGVEPRTSTSGTSPCKVGRLVDVPPSA